MSRIWFAAVSALVLVSASPALAHRPRVPAVPAAIAVSAGNELFWIAYAVGTQNYICLPSGDGYAWQLFGPQATLTRANGRQIGTHFLSPNPDEAGTLRPTWLHGRDSSQVWGRAAASSSDPAFVAPGAIPWLRVEAVGSVDGEDGILAQTTWILRVNTAGGTAPAAGCAAAGDVGKRSFEPYYAEYFFFRAAEEDD